jgi:hypothetical protein
MAEQDTRKGASKETPITKATPTYGIADTQTKILPGNFCMWVANVLPNRGIRFDISMTDPKVAIRSPDLTNNISAWSTSLTTTGCAGYGSVFLEKEAASTGTIQFNGTDRASTNATGFTARLNNNSRDTTAQVGWFDYYQELYQFYTVLGCEYDITIENLHHQNNIDAIIGLVESGSHKPPMAATVGTVKGAVDVYQALAWKHVRWNRLNSGSGQRNITKFKGVYRPGDHKREVIDDDNVKTWIPVNSSPSLKEDLSLMCYGHPQMAQATSVTTGAILNIYIQLKYIVQFKDLKDPLQFIIGKKYSADGENVSATQDLPGNIAAEADQIMGESV